MLTKAAFIWLKTQYKTVTLWNMIIIYNKYFNFYLIDSCDGKADFSALLQSSASHDSLEYICLVM